MTVAEFKEILANCPDNWEVNLSYYDNNVQHYIDVDFSGKYETNESSIGLGVRDW